ncbi:glycosyltransferase family 4 protein, partial [Ornithinimicrobium kibberense]
MRPLHVITPGDHYSPQTGSAIPTVVHGLCAHGPADAAKPHVAVARGTNPIRYTSADIIEYESPTPIRYPLGLSSTRADAATGRVGLPRFSARRSYRAVLHDQDAWASSLIFGHNAPQLVPLVDTYRHIPILYAHNQLLRTYSKREAGRTLSPAAAVICVSDFLAQQTVAHLPPHLHGRVRVVPNGVDTGLFFRRTPLRSSDVLTVTFVGRMIPEKGADVVLEALAMLNRDDIRLTLIGSRGFSATDPVTPFERAVRARASEL